MLFDEKVLKKIKIVVIGDQSVGKSSIIQRYVN